MKPITNSETRFGGPFFVAFVGTIVLGAMTLGLVCFLSSRDDADGIPTVPTAQSTADASLFGASTTQSNSPALKGSVRGESSPTLSNEIHALGAPAFEQEQPRPSRDDQMSQITGATQLPTNSPARTPALETSIERDGSAAKLAAIHTAQKVAELRGQRWLTAEEEWYRSWYGWGAIPPSDPAPVPGSQ